MSAPGRWALVTGASNRGGAAISRALHARGMSIVVHHTGRSIDKAHALRDELERVRAGSTCLWSAEFTDAPFAVPAWLVDRGIDVLVCNASVYEPSTVGDVERMRIDFDVHVRSHAAMLAALEHGLRSVVAITDIAVDRPPPGHLWYTIAKGALQTLVLALANEWAPRVRCNVVQPGTLPYPEAWIDAERARRIDASIPLGRVGSFEDLAGAVVYLALDATYVTGQVIAVDGGRSRRLH